MPKKQTVTSEKVAAVRRWMLNSQFHRVQIIADLLRRRLDRYGIGTPQAVVLLVVFAHDGIEPAQISDRTLIPRQTVTSVLDKLEKSNLVLRCEHPSDRRRKVIMLTDEGFEMAFKICTDIAAFESRLVEVFTAEEIAIFAKLNNKLAKRLAELENE